MAVVASVLPLLVLAVRVLSHAWGNPGGDLALIELRVRDVGADTPLLGSYGRYGFNQPGPLWFYVLTLPYRLVGSRYAGLQVGVLVVNAAAVVTVLVVARRRGGTVPVLLAAALLAVLLHGLGGRWLADPWEPHGLTLVCAALIFLAGDAVLGGQASLVATAVVAALLAQAQAGLAPFAGLILLVTLVAVLVRSRRLLGDESRRATVTTVLIAAGGLRSAVGPAAPWSPPTRAG